MQNRVPLGLGVPFEVLGRPGGKAHPSSRCAFFVGFIFKVFHLFRRQSNPRRCVHAVERIFQALEKFWRQCQHSVFGFFRRVISSIRLGRSLLFGDNRPVVQFVELFGQQLRDRPVAATNVESLQPDPDHGDGEFPARAAQPDDDLLGSFR